MTNKKQLKSGRGWIPYATTLGLAAIIVGGLWPRAIPVEVGQVITGPLQAVVSEEGKTRIRQRFVVSAPTTGQLRRIPHKPGAKVEAGVTLVAVIDPIVPRLLDARTRNLAEARRDTAAANLEKSRVASDFASSEFRRIERLYSNGTVSVQEFEAAEWRKKTTNKDITAAESSLREAEAELGAFTGYPAGRNEASSSPIELKSPVTGQILRVFEESSRAVEGGTALVEIGDPADLEVVVEVLSRDGAAIAPGTRVNLEHWGGDTPLEARVRLVEPAAFTKISALGVEEQRVNLIADLVAPPDQRLGLGDNFRVEARIIIWETNQTLKVPAGALFRDGAEWAVFAVSDGRAGLKRLRVGRSSGVETQVLEGLKEGDEVILYPGDRVRDGIRVVKLEI